MQTGLIFVLRCYSIAQYYNNTQSVHGYFFAMHQTATNPGLPAPAASVLPHVVGNQADVLQRILDPDVNLCLWQRSARPAVIREVASLQATDLPDVRCSTSLDAFDEDVSTLLQQQGLDPLAFSNWRIDMRRLADLYFRVSVNRDVTLRLVTTDDDDCRRFHVDRTQLRLLCTYRGPGTEWLPDEQVDRYAQSTGAPNEDIIRFGEPSAFEAFWVGILKGDAFPGNAGNGVVHRSPSIAHTGRVRVLFCLDC